MIRARLLVKVGEMKGAAFELGEEATIGRDPGNAVVLPAKAVSGAHARIFYDRERGSYLLEDLGSLNGTELDGEPVVGAEPLGRLHVVTVAGVQEFIFQGPELCASLAPPAAADGVEAADEAGEAEPAGGATLVDAEPPSLPASLASAGAGDAGEEGPAAAGGATLVDAEPPSLPAPLAGAGGADEAGGAEQAVGGATLIDAEPPSLPASLAGAGPVPPAGPSDETRDAIHIPARAAAGSRPGAGGQTAPGAGFGLLVTNFGPLRLFGLAAGDNLIGRGQEAQVRIKSPDISRRHAMLTVVGGKVVLRDLGSRNHSFLGGEPVEAGVELEVEPGAELRFGSVEARLVRGGGGS